MNPAFDKKFGETFLATVPSAPGVYLFLDRGGEVVYVGKAKSLRDRLAQYRNAKRTKAHRKMRRIVRESASITLRPMATEADALLAENELIATLRPPLNVDGAFSFLYPTIGLKRTERHLHLAYSTQADALADEGFQRFGCYRNRRVARAGFDGLVSLLSWMGHVEGAPHTLEYTTWRRFRQIPEAMDGELAGFLLGDSEAFLRTVVMDLLDKPAARRDASEVQASIRATKRFFATEGAKLVQLRGVLEAEYIPHTERDQASIRARF